MKLLHMNRLIQLYIVFFFKYLLIQVTFEIDKTFVTMA